MSRIPSHGAAQRSCGDVERWPARTMISAWGKRVSRHGLTRLRRWSTRHWRATQSTELVDDKQASSRVAPLRQRIKMRVYLCNGIVVDCPLQMRLLGLGANASHASLASAKSRRRATGISCRPGSSILSLPSFSNPSSRATHCPGAMTPQGSTPRPASCA